MSAIDGSAQGSILTTNASMSTIAWDGIALGTSDYSGTNRAFRIGAPTSPPSTDTGSAVAVL